MAGVWTVAVFGVALAAVGMEQGVAPAPPTTLQPTTQTSDVAPPQQSQEVVDDAQQSSAAAPALTAGSGKDESGGTMYELNVRAPLLLPLALRVCSAGSRGAVRAQERA